jgi:hypothetical protein
MVESGVVYYYADPAYGGDMTAALSDLSDRGYRVVKGDNADELLFLLQVGRPAAVIYTLATSDSITSAAFQMVSRRAFDLLVPIVAVGPEDPRDGLTLVYPDGRKAAKRHVPFHSLAALIREYAEAPPTTTPSRPPEAIKRKTLGRGRTLLSWKPPPSVVELPANADEAEAALREKRTADKRTLEMPAAAAAQLVEDHAATHETPTERPVSDVQTLEMPAAAAAQFIKDQAAQKAKETDPEIPRKITPKEVVPAAESEVEQSGVQPRIMVESSQEIDEPSIGALMREAEVEATARSRPVPRRSRPWRILGPLLGLAALGAIAVVIYLATRPAGPPPQPLRPGELAEGPGAPGSAVQPPAPTPVAPPTPRVAPEPAPEPAKEPEPKPAAEPKMPEQVEVEPTPEELAAALPLPVENLVPGRRVRFPAHFRPGSATFWYSDHIVEEQLLTKVRALGPGRIIHIVGHPTVDEARAKQWFMGLSRAWAVEKYLIRNGVDPESIETSRGKPVEPREDMDERGWLRNRWVDIEIK